MILTEAIEFSKQFPNCNPKIFSGLSGTKFLDPKTQGYSVLTTLTNESLSNQMDGYIKNHKLKVEKFKDYWMVYTHI
jgi:hypothetical protein